MPVAQSEIWFNHVAHIVIEPPTWDDGRPCNARTIRLIGADGSERAISIHGDQPTIEVEVRDEP